MIDEITRYRAGRVAAWLRHVVSLESKIKALASEVAAQTMLAEGVRSVALDGMPRGSGGGDALANAIARIDDMREELAAELEGYRRERAEAVRILLGIDDEARFKAVMLRHVERLRWSEVAFRMGYGESRARELCDEGLASLWYAIPHEWRDPDHSAI